MTGWWTYAACKGMPLDAFFPRKGERATEAERTCAGCPVSADCYADAEDHRASGMWGGVRWNDGHPGRDTRETTLANYDADTRAKAVALYRRLRTRYRNEKNTLDAVVQQLDLRDPSAVRKWVEAAVPYAVRQPGGQKRKTPDERAQALAMLHRIRDQHPTMKAAAQVVARAYGVHHATVCGWHEKAQTEQRQQVGAAA